MTTIRAFTLLEGKLVYSLQVILFFFQRMDDVEESVNDSVNQDQFLGSLKGKTIKSRISWLGRMKTCSVSAAKALEA